MAGKVTKDFDLKTVQQEGMTDLVYEQPHDLVALPSKGLFSKNKVDRLKVGYLTADDENILSSPNYIQSGDFSEILVDKKILMGQGIKAKDLIAGDFLAILLYLRTTAGYGDDYVFTLTDPKTSLEFKHTLDISTLKTKEITLTPDENGECDFFLPVAKKNIKFKYLTIEEEKELVKKDNQNLSRGGQSKMSTYKLAKQITELDGQKDKGYIETFITKEMSLRDSRELREYMAENEPGMDIDIEVSAPSGAVFQTQVPIGFEFFWGNNK